MPTWNTSKPATANSVAADVADIEENFDYLEDLLTYKYKTWSASSAAISKDSFYYCDPAAADQGAATNARSIKSIVDAIGGTKKAIIYLPHLAADGNTTTYTVTTDETVTSNFTIIAENGVEIAGAGTLTISGTIINLGSLTIAAATTVVVSATTGYMMDLGPVTETGTLTISGFRLSSVVSAGAASIAEVNAGTSTSVFATPDALAGSNLGTKVMIVTVFPYPTTPTTGDAKVVIPIPLEMNGMNLVAAHAFQYGLTTGVTTINVTRYRVSTLTPNDMLSTPITIDAGEYSSYTAAVQPVIDTDYDDVIAAVGTADDHVNIDVDAVGTGALGLTVNLSFRLP